MKFEMKPCSFRFCNVSGQYRLAAPCQVIGGTVMPVKTHYAELLQKAYKEQRNKQLRQSIWELALCI